MLLDIDGLRRHLLSYCEWVDEPIVEAQDVESAGVGELCRIAERLGVELEQFEVDGEPSADTFTSASRQTPIVLDPDIRFSEDKEWVDDLHLMASEYLAGGFGNLERAPRLKAVLDDVEGLYSDNIDVPEEDLVIPEELMRRYIAVRCCGFV